VEFLSEHGDLPMLQADMSGIQSIDPILAAYVGDDLMEITEYQKGERWQLAWWLVLCVV
jgi:hypothetical protein